MDLETIFAEIKTTTIGIYYKELKELVDYILTLERKTEHIIYVNPRIYDATKKIGKYFEIEVIETHLLPEDMLIVIADKKYLKPNMEEMWWEV